MRPCPDGGMERVDVVEVTDAEELLVRSVESLTAPEREADATALVEGHVVELGCMWLIPVDGDGVLVLGACVAARLEPRAVRRGVEGTHASELGLMSIGFDVHVRKEFIEARVGFGWGRRGIC